MLYRYLDQHDTAATSYLVVGTTRLVLYSTYKGRRPLELRYGSVVQLEDCRSREVAQGPGQPRGTKPAHEYRQVPKPIHSRSQLPADTGPSPTVRTSL